MYNEDDFDFDSYKEGCIAIAENETASAFVTSMYECGWAIFSKVDGRMDYDDNCSIIETLKKFADFARKHNIKTVNIMPEYLDIDALKEIDRKFWQDRDDEEYAEACMASAYGNDSLMERYNRKHGIEKDYGPSNPWDAPGMSIHDFI